MNWIYFVFVCGLLSCDLEQTAVTEAQCKELARAQRVRTDVNGRPVFVEACLAPDGKWWPGRIGEPAQEEINRAAREGK